MVLVTILHSTHVWHVISGDVLAVQIGGEQPPLETSDGQFPLVQRNTIPPRCRLRSTIPAVAPLQKKGKGIEMDAYFNG